MKGWKSINTIFTALALLWASCSTTSGLNSGVAGEPVPVSNPTVVFLSFQMVKNADGSVSIVSTGKKEVEGTLKQGRNEHYHGANLLYLEHYSNEQKVRTITMEHPLHKSVEYAGEGNELRIQSIEPDSAAFFVRLQKEPGENSVRISEQLAGKTKTHILTYKW